MAPKQALRALLAVSEEGQKEKASKGEGGKGRERGGRTKKSAQVAQNVNVNK